MKIAIVGSGGRLGKALAREWARADGEIAGFDRASMNLGDGEKLRATLTGADFEVLVNCAAQTNVDYCETHEAEAHRVNAEAVGEMAAICRERGARMLHVSTDYVFDGEKREPYTEDDAPGPLGAYAASKLAGERALAETLEDSLSVRVSWVFGPDRPSFVDQILQKAAGAESVAAIGDKWAAPTYALDASRLLRPFLRDVPARGILHLCNAGKCTWQEYGQFALDCARRAGVALKAETVGFQKMADLKAFVAKRPVDTAMSAARLIALSGQQPRNWQDAVEEYVREFVAPRMGAA